MSTTFSLVVYVNPPHARPNRPSTIRMTPSVLLTAAPVGSGYINGEEGQTQGAIVTLTGQAGLSKTTVAANDGSYSFLSLPPGNYTVQASAPGLSLREPAKISA